MKNKLHHLIYQSEFDNESEGCGLKSPMQHRIDPDMPVEPNKPTKCACPLCRFIFIAGGSISNVVNCPACNLKFKRAFPHSNCQGNGKLYGGANNVYFKDDCPALMSDGRFITYYNSSNELTEAMRKMNGFKSANQFRTFMQNNGDLFMASERKYIIDKNTCEPHTACSEGWYDLWTKRGGYWAANSANPNPNPNYPSQPMTYSLNH